MLAPSDYKIGDIIAVDWAYIEFEEMTCRHILYVTRMKKNLRYETQEERILLNDNHV